MKREIKFRAFGDPTDGTARMWESHQIDYNWIKKDGNPFVFMEFTGIKDKSGKEIYEGDILKGFYDFGHGRWWMTVEIFYDYSGFRLKVIEGDKNRKGQVNYADFVERDGTIFQEIEIIGNIHENPELTK